jgi:hypothetical protein
MKKKKKSISSCILPLELKKRSHVSDSALNFLYGLEEAKSYAEVPREFLRLLGVLEPMKAAFYPTRLKSFEEYHLPLSGHEHWILCLLGKIEVVERLSGQKCVIEPNESVSITRAEPFEYPNLKVIAPEIPSKLIWIIRHKDKGIRVDKGVSLPLSLKGSGHKK